MTERPDAPQLYLITPPEIALSRFPSQLAAVLDAVEIACLRLALSTRDEDSFMRSGDAVRDVAHKRDVPVVVETHFTMADRLGLDGVHLTDGPRTVRAARKALGPDAIVGSFCDASRHDGMSAGEAGADYVAFGPVSETAMGGQEVATADLFAWWSEMIELPVVAEGAVTLEAAARLAPITDFFAIGAEIWDADAPVAAVRALHKAIS